MHYFFWPYLVHVHVLLIVHSCLLVTTKVSYCLGTVLLWYVTLNESSKKAHLRSYTFNIDGLTIPNYLEQLQAITILIGSVGK